MGFFDRFRDSSLNKNIESFLRGHEGVEAYLEPKTINFSQSVLLIDRGGDWRRVPVKEPRQAAAACRKLGIPFYDARVVGYPERMRGARGEPAPDAPTAEELERWMQSGEG